MLRVSREPAFPLLKGSFSSFVTATDRRRGRPRVESNVQSRCSDSSQGGKVPRAPCLFTRVYAHACAPVCASRRPCRCIHYFSISPRLLVALQHRRGWSFLVGRRHTTTHANPREPAPRTSPPPSRPLPPPPLPAVRGAGGGGPCGEGGFPPGAHAGDAEAQKNARVIKGKNFSLPCDWRLPWQHPGHDSTSNYFQTLRIERAPPRRRSRRNSLAHTFLRISWLPSSCPCTSRTSSPYRPNRQRPPSFPHRRLSRQPRLREC